MILTILVQDTCILNVLLVKIYVISALAIASAGFLYFLEKNYHACDLTLALVNEITLRNRLNWRSLSSILIAMSSKRSLLNCLVQISFIF